MNPTVVKQKVRSNHDVLQGTGDEHLARRGGGYHARCRVDGNSAELIRSYLALAGVHAAPDVDAEMMCPLHHRKRAVHGAGRAIERRQEAISRGLHLTSTPASELLANGGIVCVENRQPAGIAESGGMRGRPNDVGEQQRGKDPLGTYGSKRHRRPLEEGLDGVDHGILVLGQPRGVKAPWNLNPPSPWYVLGDVPSE